MTERSGILLFAEVHGGKVDRRTLLALEKLRDLAGELGVYVDAVLAGPGTDEAAKELISYGAKKVFVAKDERFDMYDTGRLVDLVSAIMKSRNPEAVAFPDSFAAKDIGPRLAQRLGTSFVPECMSFSIEDRERKIVQTRKAYGGKVTLKLVTKVDAAQLFSVKVDTTYDPEPVDYARGEVIEWTDLGS